MKSDLADKEEISGVAENDVQELRSATADTIKELVFSMMDEQS
jgi:hypothetical protein